MIPALGFCLELVLRETNASEFVLQVRVLPETSAAWALKFSLAGLLFERVSARTRRRAFCSVSSRRKWRELALNMFCFGVKIDNGS